jgi:hypothetical protein
VPDGAGAVPDGAVPDGAGAVPDGAVPDGAGAGPDGFDVLAMTPRPGRARTAAGLIRAYLTGR